MRKLSSYLFALLAFSGLTLFSGCGDDPEDPATPLPEATGTVKISFAPNPNFAFESNGDVTVNAANGDLIPVTVILEKAPNETKPRKLRIWAATMPNVRGTQVKIEGQGTGDGTIDLKTARDIQKKTVDYPVTATSGTVYLYFEVEETQDKFSRRLMKINIGTPGSISTFTNITLGAQGNALPSRAASGTGDVYTACELEENIDYVDIVYLVTPQATPAVPRFMSNQRISSFGFNTTFTTGQSSACPNETVNAAGGQNTYFEALPSANWSNITNEETLLAATSGVTTGDNQDVALDLTGGGSNKLYGFVNGKGKKGIIKVNSISTTGGSYSTGTVNIDIKVQR